MPGFHTICTTKQQFVLGLQGRKRKLCTTNEEAKCSLQLLFVDVNSASVKLIQQGFFKGFSGECEPAGPFWSFAPFTKISPFSQGMTDRVNNWRANRSTFEFRSISACNEQKSIHIMNEVLGFAKSNNAVVQTTKCS